MSTKMMLLQQEEIIQLQEHLSTLRNDPTERLENTLKTLFHKHIQKFIEHQVRHYLSLPNEFLKNRNPNETVEAYYKRVLEFPDTKYTDKESYNKRSKILEIIDFWEGVMYTLTTHPIYTTHVSPIWGEIKQVDTLPGLWKSKDEREDWQDNPSRKTFKVKMHPDATTIAYKLAEKEADVVFQTFVHKAKMKVLGILKRNPAYYSMLEKSSFDENSIEGDVRLTFVDTSSFVIHLSIRRLYTNIGSPYYQYPFAFNKIYKGDKTEPAKILNQQEVEDIFGVTINNKWEPIPPKKTERWKSAKPGDVVKIKGKKNPALLLGADKPIKGNFRFQYPSGKVISLLQSQVESIIARIEITREFPKGSQKARWTYVIQNHDGTNEDKVLLDKENSDQLEKIFYSGNYKLLGSQLIYEILCNKGKWGTKKKEFIEI